MENQETRTFKIYPNIEMKPVRFKNRFGIELAGHLYLPEGYTERKNAAIIVAGPFGAVKEQAAGLYAQQFASMGSAAPFLGTVRDSGLLQREWYHLLCLYGAGAGGAVRQV